MNLWVFAMIIPLAFCAANHFDFGIRDADSHFEPESYSAPQLIDRLRKNHSSMVAINIAIAGHLVRKYRTELTAARSSMTINLMALVEWLTGITYYDPIIYLQSFLKRQPRLQSLLPVTEYKLEVETLPSLAQHSWFNAVHFGDSWVLIGAVTDPFQNLINAIHFDKVDSTQDYIVVFLKGDDLHIVESKKSATAFDLYFEQRSTSCERSPLVILAKNDQVRPKRVRICIIPRVDESVE